MPKSILYLTRTQLEFIHAGVLAKSGGLYGTRETSVLSSLETSPKQVVFGRELYPTLFHKSAVYLNTIIRQHPFLDGNKRTAVLCALTFLDVNGYTFTATDDEFFNFAVHVATNSPEIEEIADWPKRHSKKT